MKKQNKKLLLTFILSILNISLFAGYLATEGYYWDYSYSLPSTYELQDITVTDLYSSSNNIEESGINQYKGFYMGEFTVDFSKRSSSSVVDYYNLFKTSTKTLAIRQDPYFYFAEDSWIYDGRTYIKDVGTNVNRNVNGSTISGFIKITKKDQNGNILKVAWYDISSNWGLYLHQDDNFKNIKTDIFTFEYYFIINHIENLTTSKDWELIIPNITKSEWDTGTIRIGILDTSVGYSSVDSTLNRLLYNDTYIYNPIYQKNGTISVINTENASNVYNLNIDIEKKFNDSSENFFDGAIHDYYSLDFDSYKYGVLTEEPFSIVLQISSAHNWYLYLDNEENPSSNEKVGYELYLKYRPNSSYSQMLVQDSQDKILIKNIKSSSASSTIYLQTKSDQARVDSTTKGEYQDTVYLNFITDGWSDSNESSFAEKIITLQ